jgi:hypothetical protein
MSKIEIQRQHLGLFQGANPIASRAGEKARGAIADWATRPTHSIQYLPIPTKDGQLKSRLKKTGLRSNLQGRRLGKLGRDEHDL